MFVKVARGSARQNHVFSYKFQVKSIQKIKLIELLYQAKMYQYPIFQWPLCFYNSPYLYSFPNPFQTGNIESQVKMQNLDDCLPMENARNQAESDSNQHVVPQESQNSERMTLRRRITGNTIKPRKQSKYRNLYSNILLSYFIGLFDTVNSDTLPERFQEIQKQLEDEVDINQYCNFLSQKFKLPTHSKKQMAKVYISFSKVKRVMYDPENGSLGQMLQKMMRIHLEKNFIDHISTSTRIKEESRKVQQQKTIQLRRILFGESPAEDSDSEEQPHFQ